MVGEAIAGLGAFKTMLDIVKGLKDLNSAAARNTVIVELTEKILSARTQQETLLDKVGTLEAEVARLKKWKADEGKYRLINVATGAFAYGNKPNADAPEPAHWLCVNCYDNLQRRSILQYQGRTPNKQDSIYLCPPSVRVDSKCHTLAIRHRSPKTKLARWRSPRPQSRPEPPARLAPHVVKWNFGWNAVRLTRPSEC